MTGIKRAKAKWSEIIVVWRKGQRSDFVIFALRTGGESWKNFFKKE